MTIKEERVISTIIAEKIKEVASIADQLPAVVVIHDLQGFKLLYMSEYGLKLLGKKWDEIKGMDGEEYHTRFFNPEYTKESIPKILALMEQNTDDVVSFFQQVRTSKDREWDWYFSTIKILLRDEDDRPLLTVSTAMRVDPEHHFTSKAVRLLEENNFIKKHYQSFAKLTSREREVLKLLVLGKSAAEIGKALHISSATAETHRKNIYSKLQTKNSFMLSQYARAFDLI